MFKYITLCFVFLFAAPVYALDTSTECNSRVFDSTGKANTEDIKSALSPLINDGADPMVRIITAEQINSAGGNIDKYAASMVKRCSSWQAPNGNMKSNLLILAVTQDTSISSPVGIYFSKNGPLTILRGQTAGVRSAMGSTLSSDVTQSIKNGIESIHNKIINPSVTATVAKNVSGAVSSAKQNGINITVAREVHNEKPADLTFLWVLLGLIVIGSGVWFAVSIYLRQQELKAKCRGAQQTAQSRRGQCNNLIIGFDNTILQLNALLSSLKAELHLSEFTSLQNKLSAIQSRIITAKSQFVNLQGSANDPDSSGRTTDEYNSMTEDFDSSLRDLKSIDSDLKSIEQSIRKIRLLKSEAEPAIESLAAEIDKATALVKAETILKTDGSKAKLQEAISLMERATQEMADKKYQSVANTCSEAVKLAKEAGEDVSELGLRKQRVDEAIRKLDIENYSGIHLAAADAAIAKLSTKYNSDVAASVNEGRALIIQNIDSRRQAMIGAKSASFSQNWDLADTYITAMMQADDDINNSLSSINRIGQRYEQEARENTYRNNTIRPSARPSNSRSTVNHTTINNTTVVRDDSYGLGTLGAVIALDNILERESIREERRDLYEERRELESERRRDDDYGIGGDSGSCSSSNDSSSSFGMDGDSGSVSSDSSFGGDSGGGIDNGNW